MAIKSIRQRTDTGISEVKELGADAKNIDVVVQLEDGSTEVHTLQAMIDNKEISGGSIIEWTDIY